MLDEVRNEDIRLRLKEETVVEVARKKQRVERESRWYGRGKTGGVYIQRAGDWQKTKKETGKALETRNCKYNIYI